MAYDTSALSRELASFCLHKIEECEDMTRVEPEILREIHDELCQAMAHALESFDQKLLTDKPLGWRVKDARYLTLITKFSAVTYFRLLRERSFFKKTLFSP